MAKSNSEYQRKYQLERYHERRQEVMVKLGGKCSKCPNTLVSICCPCLENVLVSDWAGRTTLKSQYYTKVLKCPACTDLHLWSTNVLK